MFLSGSLSAQEGEFILNNFNPDPGRIDDRNYDLGFDSKGLLHIANHDGVVRFDGRDWDLINTPASILSIEFDERNNLFVGSRKGLGKLVLDKMGKSIYQPLVEEEGTEDLFLLEYFNGHIYAANENRLLIYDTENDFLKKDISLSEETIFFNLFFIGGEVFIDEALTGIKKISGDSLVSSELIVPDGGLVLFAEQSDENPERYIIGTSENNLFFLENGIFSNISVELDDMETGNVQISDGIWLSEHKLAVGSRTSGCIFIDPYTGKVLASSNYFTGLPDNEISVMAEDPDGGLWVSHEFGFSRIAHNLPVKSFAHYAGLDGKLLSVTEFQNTLYLATSLGVYFLDEIRNYKETVYYVEKKPEEKKEPEPQSQLQPKAEEVKPPQIDEEQKQNRAEVSKKKKGFFGFLRKSKKKQEEDTIKNKEEKKGVFGFLKGQDKKEVPEEDAEEEEKKGFLGAIFGSGKEEEQKDEEKPRKRYERRTYRELTSVNYEYRKVKGLYSKCYQMIPYRGHLILNTNTGIYEVKDTSAVLVSNSSGRFVYLSPSKNELLVATDENQIISLVLRNDIWEEYSPLPYFSEEIYHLKEDDKGNLWMTGLNEIFLLKDRGKESQMILSFEVDNPGYDPFYAIDHGGIHFYNNSGQYVYDSADEMMVYDSAGSEKYSGTNKMIFNREERLWISKRNRWELINSEVDMSVFEYLSLFPRITSLELSEDKSKIWIITDENELYLLDMEGVTRFVTKNRLFLKEVKNESGVKLGKRGLEVQQEKSHLVFEFTQPEYLGISVIEYQYQLKGLNKKWSQWSPNNQLSFNYLPPGKYELNVRTKNAFGQVVSGDPYVFTVVPPIWQRWWFYLLEIIFFGSLLLLSFRLNRLKSKSTVFSRVLTFFTLILILEFIETLVESKLNLKSSPILDFFIEATIAFSILPVERILRKFMFEWRSDRIISNKKKKAGLHEKTRPNTTTLD